MLQTWQSPVGRLQQPRELVNHSSNDHDSVQGCGSMQKPCWNMTCLLTLFQPVSHAIFLFKPFSTGNCKVAHQLGVTFFYQNGGLFFWQFSLQTANRSWYPQQKACQLAHAPISFAAMRRTAPIFFPLHRPQAFQPQELRGKKKHARRSMDDTRNSVPPKPLACYGI